MSGLKASLTLCSVRLDYLPMGELVADCIFTVVSQVDNGDAQDSGTDDLRATRLQEFNTIRTELVVFALELPPLTSNASLQPWESVALVNPHLIAVHVIYNGVLILLYNIVVVLHERGKDLHGVKVEEARKKMLEGSQGLVEISSNIRRKHTIHAFHVNVILFVSPCFGVPLG